MGERIAVRPIMDWSKTIDDQMAILRAERQAMIDQVLARLTSIESRVTSIETLLASVDKKIKV